MQKSRGVVCRWSGILLFSIAAVAAGQSISTNTGGKIVPVFSIEPNVVPGGVQATVSVMIANANSESTQLLHNGDVYRIAMNEPGVSIVSIAPAALVVSNTLTASNFQIARGVGNEVTIQYLGADQVFSGGDAFGVSLTILAPEGSSSSAVSFQLPAAESARFVSSVLPNVNLLISNLGRNLEAAGTNGGNDGGGQGPPGPKGDKGDPGPPGPKGDKGDLGGKGLDGAKGDKGDHGDQGEKGEAGLRGDKGDHGDKGDKGDKGEKGDAGFKGDKGDKGLDGGKGDKGDRGDKGDKGDAGLKGDKGDHGDKGDKGEKGDAGLKGDKGDKGDKGLDGGKGDKGDRGDKGDHGDNGLPGPKGDKGDLGPPGPKGDKGDKGDHGDRGDKGDKGDKGDIGPQGAAGPVGATGATGASGPVGPVGPAGPAGLDGQAAPSISTISTTTVLGPAVYDEPGATTQAKPRTIPVTASDLEWTTCYFAIYGGERSLSIVDVAEPLGNGGVITRFTVGINGAPVTGTWTFSVLKGNTTILPSCTVSGTSRTCSSIGYAPFLPTDPLSIRMTVGTGEDAPQNMFSTASFQLRYTAQ